MNLYNKQTYAAMTLLLITSSGNLMSMMEAYHTDTKHEDHEEQEHTTKNQEPSTAQKAYQATKSAVKSTGDALNNVGKTISSSAKSAYDAIPSLDLSETASKAYHALPDLTGTLKTASTSAYDAAKNAKNAVMEWFKGNKIKPETVTPEQKTYIKSIVDFASRLNPADAAGYVSEKLNSLFGRSKQTETDENSFLDPQGRLATADSGDSLQIV